jgi:hypothetical protein
MSAKYAGWVPTVSGNLSFTMVGNTSHPKKARTANVEVENKRYILSEQRRVLGDITFPWLPQPLYDTLCDFIAYRKGLHARFRFVFRGMTDKPQGSMETQLQGRVYIFVDDDNYWENIRPSICRAVVRMNQAAKNGRDGTAEAREAYDEIAKTLDKASAVVDVCLHRNGCCFVAEPMHVEQSELAFVFDTEDERWTVASQSFYFIKDLAHRHSHHHRRTDTICDLYFYHERGWPSEEGEGHRASPLEDWRNLSLYSIYRVIIGLKRDFPNKAFERGDGLLAYAESFRRICDARAAKADKPDFPETHVHEVRQSIAAANREYEQRISYASHKQTLILNFLIGCLIILSTSIAIMRGSGIQAPVREFDAEFVVLAYTIVRNIWTSMGVALAGVIAFILYWPPGASVDRPHFRDLLRLVVALPKMIVGPALILTGIGIIVGFFWLAGGLM